MDTNQELNNEIREMYEEMTSPEKQEERALKQKDKKIIERSKQRLGL